ncbi:MAG TPA: DNA polymerase III subunit alpha [Acholeplasmataceae bacterium]|nr:DNA polymerase III subunit alpha [Acholeplasmataceae bacterium]
MRGVFYLQSSYSMLKNIVRLKDLIDEAKKEAYDFIALSDELLHGMITFFDLMEYEKIKPVIGITLKVIEPFETGFLIYVKNEIGYQNLLELQMMKTNGNHFTIEDLIAREHGLIFVTDGNSVIDNNLFRENFLEADELINKYKKYFKDFYIGINYNHSESLKESVYKTASKHSVPVVLVNQTSYLNVDDKKAYEALSMLGNYDYKMGNSFIGKEHIDNEFKKYLKLEDGHMRLIKSVEFKLDFPKYDMPKFVAPNNVSEEKYLMSLARVGLKRRLELSNIKDDSKYIKRLEHELSVITKMKFSRYFLIVYDFVKYAKQNDILVGPGRGSAAGSLVSYCLGITDIDPVKYKLMFERFLNPERMSMPDIDIDFPDNKRDLVIDYVKEKYGINHICSISTYNTFAVNSSIRDIARVLNFPLDRVSAVINSYVSNTVDESDLEVMEILEIASKIKGLPRHTGTHPAGIILSDQDLTKSIPMQRGSFDFNQSQFDADTLERLGLTKIDFLGIKNLTIIDDILKIINKDKKIIDLNKLNLEDKKTYELLSKGDTTGVFQLESDGMRNVLRKLKPNNFEDIVAVLALYRPGPMENIDTFIERRAGLKFEYLHNDLEDILRDTYGIIVYQEQIMQIAVVFAGYNLFEADLLRVGVSKKDKVILENERAKFVRRSVENKYSKDVATKIYDYIVRFADYGFNRSHSVAYGLVAYQMAYLKANYYGIFMSVLLSHVIGNLNQTEKYISEVTKKGIKVYPPNLNYSKDKYVVYKDGILMPLLQIKGIGIKTYEKISEERGNGIINNFFEAKTKLSKILSENEFKQLIYANALDFTGLNKKTMILNSDFEDVFYSTYLQDYKITETDDYSYLENMDNERNAIGVNLRYNILEYYKNDFEKIGVTSIGEAIKHKKQTRVIGLIKSIREISTKNNEKMAFLSISDGFSELDLTVFPRDYQGLKVKFLKEVLIFEINPNEYRGELKFTLQNIHEMPKT